ncbi:general stress protein [Exiguobacterium flavidum]|uniref:general stress protein n=1 Tax=Exiguobacterium flavidum TaxID=2184695 RepID=UPI000DF79F8D|nr:general stress protein [Exiguobacterium flavidum]
MGQKQYIGTYFDETGLIRAIEDLHFKGYLEEDLFVVLQDKKELAMLRGQSSAELVSAKRGLWDKFTGKKSTDEETRDVFRELGLAEGDIERHHADVERGGYVLIADEEGARRGAPMTPDKLADQPEGIEAERRLDHENRILESENDRM